MNSFPQHCFNCVLQILICYFHQLYAFIKKFHSSLIHVFQKCVLEFPSVWKFSYCLSVIDFQFVFVVIREHSLYDINSFKFVVVFQWFRIWSILITVNAYEECMFCCCRVEYCINANWILLFDSVSEFFLCPCRFSVQFFYQLFRMVC